jgi:predicted methyltransferase
VASTAPTPLASSFLLPHLDLLPPPEDDPRSDEDREKDAARHPTELLAFIGIKPGQRVGEIGAGTGYTTELLARAVGDTGAVYGQNPRWLLDKFAEGPWSARLARPAMKHVTRLDREFDDPFPPDVKDLDAVVSMLFYHDTVWLNVDRGRMNRAVFAALKRGGVYVIVDHSAQAGSGIRDVKTFHRIDESFVKAEVTGAGFTLAATGDFLRNPSDTRDWNDSPGASDAGEQRSDRFVLKFEKP